MNLEQMNQRVFFAWIFGACFLFALASCDRENWTLYGQIFGMWFCGVGIVYGALRLLALIADLAFDVMGRLQADPEKQKRELAAPLSIQVTAAPADPHTARLQDQDALAWLLLDKPSIKGTAMLQRLQIKEEQR